MKIALAGYYGHQEKCDDLLEYAVMKNCRELMGPVEWVRIENIDKHADIDMAILGGGSLIGHEIYIIDNLAAWLKNNAHVPLHIFGTGVRDIDLTKAKDTVKYLFDRAETTMVRGHSSRKRLEKIGVHVDKDDIGDPIFLLKHKGDPRGGGYIGGVVRPMGKFRAVEDALYLAAAQREQPVNLFSFCAPQMDNMYTTRGFRKFDLDLFNSYLAVKHADFWIGNRLHPFCIALNEGVPTVGINIEFDKVHDVCTSLDYPTYYNDGDVIPHFKIDSQVVIRAMNNAAILRGRLKERLKEILT